VTVPGRSVVASATGPGYVMYGDHDLAKTETQRTLLDTIPLDHPQVSHVRRVEMKNGGAIFFSSSHRWNGMEARSGLVHVHTGQWWGCDVAAAVCSALSSDAPPSLPQEAPIGIK
jgi:hypothetical protein